MRSVCEAQRAVTSCCYDLSVKCSVQSLALRGSVPQVVSPINILTKTILYLVCDANRKVEVCYVFDLTVDWVL